MRKALFPFAAEYEQWAAAGVGDDTYPLISSDDDHMGDSAHFKVGDLHLAAQLLTNNGPAQSLLSELSRLRGLEKAAKELAVSLPREMFAKGFTRSAKVVARIIAALAPTLTSTPPTGAEQETKHEDGN